MSTNEFAKISKLVDGLVQEYTKTRKACDIPENGWNNRTIMRISKPFIQGYFTLAIVGKVSSGKSTFINALLGTHNLLPTGHDQTTCGITYIEYGDIPEIKVTFGNNNIEVIKGDGISSKLLEYVAIPDRYHNLPVNNIDEMILGGLSYQAIEKCKKQLEEKTLCPPIDTNLLKEYVTTRSIDNIVKEVRMKFPFNEELKGWRIIDTPGIGAIGGIEDKTKELLAKRTNGNKEVDAIIFLQDGSQTLDQLDTAKFIQETLEEFTEEDKRKLFFVLTHSGAPIFLNHKTENLEKIRQSYSAKINCLTYADSLLYLFINSGCVGDLRHYDEIRKPDIFSVDEWDSICASLAKAKQIIRDEDEDTVNHTTMLRKINEWSNFENLKKSINDFAKAEKEQSLHHLIKLIQDDMDGFKKKLHKMTNVAKEGSVGIQKSKEKLKSQRQHFSNTKEKADREINKVWVLKQFDYVDKTIEEISSIQSIPKVRTVVNDLLDKAEKTEKEIFDFIKNKYKDFFKMTDSDIANIESVDFDAIEIESEKDKNDYVLQKERKYQPWCKDEVRIPAKYDWDKMEQDKIRDFKALAIKQARATVIKFQQDICRKVDDISIQIGKELGRIISEAEKELNSIEEKLSQKDELIKKWQIGLEQIKDSQTKCKILIDNYGSK